MLEQVSRLADQSYQSRNTMNAITVNLISGRTIQQGVSMEGGKDKNDYRLACGIIEIDEADFKQLGIMKNTNVKVTSDFGDVIVKAVSATQGPHPGVAFIPMGPWANKVTSTETYSTGMPTFKGGTGNHRAGPDRTGHDFC